MRLPVPPALAVALAATMIVAGGAHAQPSAPPAGASPSGASPSTAPAAPTTPAAASAAAPQAAAAPPPVGDVRYLAANCANCHGTAGRAVPGANMPALAGLSRVYFVEQMTAFREGKRPATIMHQLAKGYSDEQIAALADWFSKQPPQR